MKSLKGHRKETPTHCWITMCETLILMAILPGKKGAEVTSFTD